MSHQEIISSLLLEEGATLTYIEVCQYCHITEPLLEEMIEHGLITTESHTLESLRFDVSMLERIQIASRLHQDLGVNIAGVSLALELLDELKVIRRDLLILKRHVDFTQ